MTGPGSQIEQSVEQPGRQDMDLRRRATTELETTFLVEAGAGTGKTNILVQRFIALMKAGRSRLERVAAITFTERAATELRVRLRTELDTALAGFLPDNERRNLRTAQRQLEKAAISTVHAFCATLLRERSVEARVDPDCVVLDQLSAGLLRNEVWQTWLAEEMDRRPTILKRVFRAGLTLAHLETLRDFVVEQRDCLSLLPAPVEPSLPAFQTVFRNSLARLLILKTSCISEADRALTQISTLAALVPESDEETVWQRLVSQPLPVQPKAGNKANWRPAAALNEVRSLLGRIGTAHASARSVWFHNTVIALVQWLKGYLHAYQERKQSQRLLDFADLLIFTRDLLTSHLAVRRYFQNRFDFLLVDEFQDTDPLQAEIMFFLAEQEPQAADWRQVALRPGKLFLVGDPQQSIYRFRRADLEVYRQARAALKRQGEVLVLSTNFRTRAPILDWINTAFGHAPSNEEELNNPAYRPLVAARQEEPLSPLETQPAQDQNQEPAQEAGPAVIFLPLPNELASVRTSREECRQAEAKTVAAFVKNTVEQGKRAGGGGVQIRYHDIAIVFRTYQAMEIYEDTFREVEIPYRVFGGRRYASRPEIEELRTLLRTIESPADALALVATLRSALFGFTDEEVAQFVALGGRLDYTTQPVGPASPLADRFTAAFAVLRNFHARRAQVSPVRLLYEIYTQTHLIPLFALRPQGSQNVANLLKLIDIAQALDAQGVRTLIALNRFLDQQERTAEESEPLIVEEQDDALRFLTIHKAKGLEFPMVIVADAASPQNRSSWTGLIERGEGKLELQVGPRSLAWTTLGWQKAEAREQARAAAEERRLWYVAVTRARDRLVVPVVSQTEARVGEGLGVLMGKQEQTRRRISSYQNIPRVPDPADVMASGAGPSAVSPGRQRRQFSSISPHPASFQIYQEWQAGRQAIREKGRRGGAVHTVAALVETHFPDHMASQHTNSVYALSQDAGLHLGRAVHTALQTSGNRPEELSTEWLGNGLRSPAERAEAARLVNNILASAVIARGRVATKRFFEVPFLLHVQEGDYNGLIEGSVDLAFIENGAWVLVAFKSDTSTALDREKRLAGYRSQLALSALALERLTHNPVKELVLLFAGAQREVSFAWDNTERTRALAILATLSNAAEQTQ